MFYTSLSRILGLVREIISAALLGTSALADVFRVAFIIPNFLRRLFAEGTMATAFVPTFKATLLEEDEKGIRHFLSASLTLLSCFVGLTVALGILASPLIIRWFFESEPAETILQTRIMFPYLAFISLAALFQGILNASDIYAPSGFMPILFNICVILSAFLLKDLLGNPARAMAVGVVVGGFLQAAFQLPFVLKEGFRLSFIPLRRALAHPGVHKMGRLIAPTIFGMAAYQINDFVASSLASRAGTGVISSLLFSLRLQELVLGIVVVSISTVLLTELSANAQKGHWEQYNKKLSEALNIMVLLTLPIVVYSQIHGKEIISLLFKQAAFTEESVLLTLSAFRWHIAAIVFIGFNRILAPVFYSMYNTKAPAWAGVISVAVNLLLVALFAGPWKGAGIALAGSLAALANTFVLLILLTQYREITLGQLLKKMLAYIGLVGLVSLLAAVPIYFLKEALLGSLAGRRKLILYGLPIALDALVFFIIIFGILYLFKDPPVRSLLGVVSRRIKRKRS